MWRCPSLVVLLLLLPRAALTQPVTRLESIGDVVNAGDVVRVVEWSGRVTTGRVATLSADALGLDGSGGARESLERERIREVSFRQPDSLRNGTLIGFVTVAGATCAAAASHGLWQSCGLPSLILGGLGAPVGALVDAAIRRRVVVFRAAERQVVLSVRPLAVDRGGGVSVGWRW